MTQQPKIMLYFLLLRLLPEYLFIKRYIFLFLGSLYFLIPKIAIFSYSSDCYIFVFLRLLYYLFPQTALRLTAPALAFQDHRCHSQGEDALARFLHLASALYLCLHLCLYL